MTLSQVGSFYAGTVGFPIRYTLFDSSVPPVVLIPTTILLTDINSAQLDITRPDKSTFSRTLAMPASYVGGAIQYVLQTGDLNAGGEYNYVLTLSLSGSRVLPVSGQFAVLH
jgi:hypothetical protein